MDIVKVKWCRTRFVPGEAPIEECREENYDVFESLGFLISENADKVIIGHERIANDYSDINAIPRGCIIELSYLSTPGTPM